MADPVYEMLWDCSYCSTKKLLGLTHRHCPSCGAKQDPDARYFPSEQDKVAVHSHEFVGADLVCRYCSAACSRRAHNCGQCGAPLSEGTAVRTVAEPEVTPLAALSAPAPTAQRSRSAWKIIAPLAALGLLAVMAVVLLSKKERSFVVASHAWQRTIHVERFGPVRKSAWCEALPSEARDVSRHRERRGIKQVPDGEECQTKRQDRGDGTFVEKQDCRPKLKDEPIFDDKCEFAVEQWASLREVTLEGTTPAQPPRWPEPLLARAQCSQVGCEREGRREERYTLVLRDSEGERYRCDFAEPVWSRFTDGKSYQGKQRSLVGSLDCGSLTP
jgi:hypothetical protein